MVDRNDSGDGAFLPGFLLRFAAALLLVLLTYNPTGLSFVHWLRRALETDQAGALHALAGVALLIGWIVFLRTAWASLGVLGLVLGSMFLGTLVWVLVEFNVVDVASAGALQWIVLVCVAVLLAVGMSWGVWKRRASGQVEVDEAER